MKTTQKLLALVLVALAGLALASVPSTTSRNDYVADGSTLAFSYTFQTPDATWVQVLVNGVVQTSGYTTSRNSNQTTTPGGTVTFLSPPASGAAVRILRKVPLTRTTNYPVYGAFPSATVNADVDKVTMALQQLDRDKLGLSWRGVWSSGTTYAAQDTVLYNGSSYLAIAGSTGIQPDVNPGSWVLLASTGAQGPAGPSGIGPPFGNPGGALYVKSDTGNDSNDCQSWTSACRTILGAYDKMPVYFAQGGTIYLADESYVGGEVANQGIWIGSDSGPGQPEWTPFPAGWRHYKPVTFIGVPTVHGWYYTGARARIYGGQPGGSGFSSSDATKPAIWYADELSGVSFENIQTENTAQAIKLGVAPGTNRRDAIVANVKFKNCYFGNHTSSTNPVVDVGYAFWIYWDHVTLNRPAAADPTQPTAQAMYVNPGNGGANTYLFYVRDSVWVNGGIYYFPGTLGGGLDVRDLFVEGGGTNSLPPAVWIDGYGTNFTARLENVNSGDGAAGSLNAIKLTPSAGAISGAGFAGVSSQVVVMGIQEPPAGPCTILGQIPFNTFAAKPFSPLGSGLLGAWGGKLWGEHDGAKMQTPFSSARFANRFNSVDDMASFNTTVTKNQADPYGGTTAVKINNNNAFSVNVTIHASHDVLSVGDAMYVGFWTKGGGSNNTRAVPVIGKASGAGVFGSTRHDNSRGPSDDWDWVYAISTVTTGGDTYWTAYATIAATSPAGQDFYVSSPVVHYIPAGSIGTNDLATWATYLGPTGPNAPAGSISAVDGVSIDFSRNDVATRSVTIQTVSVLSGAGDPSNVVTASPGSLYLRIDGSTTTSLYVKTSGSGNTGWTAK